MASTAPRMISTVTCCMASTGSSVTTAKHFRTPRAGLPFGLSPLWPATALAIGLAVFFILSRKHSITVLAWAVLIMGAVDLLEALFSKPPSVIAWMEQWVPLGVTEKSRLLLLFSGLLLLSLSRGLRRHKRIAWLLALALLCISAVLHLTRAFDWHHALGAIVLIIPLVRWRKDFVARSDAPSIRIAWVMARGGGARPLRLRHAQPS